VVNCHNLRKKIDDKSVEQVLKITFDYDEVGNVDEFQVYEAGV
jgi:hypothetical protein